VSGHLSLRPTWTSPGWVDGPAWPCTGRGLPGRRVTATPVRSYRTFSPLPVRDSRAVAPSAVCFCGTFPRVSPGGRYPPPCPVVSGLSSRRFSLRAAVRSARMRMVVLRRPAANRRNSASSVVRIAPQFHCARSPPSLRPPPCLVFARPAGFGHRTDPPWASAGPSSSRTQGGEV